MPDLLKIILERWYILVTSVIVCWTVSSFSRKYPDYHAVGHETLNRIKESETIIDDYLKITDKRTVTKNKSLITIKDNPFRQTSKVTVHKTTSGKKTPQPSRNFKLTGISGKSSAILIDNNGAAVIVSIGEEVDGATVLEIKTDRIIMRDNAGSFEIPMQ